MGVLLLERPRDRRCSAPSTPPAPVTSRRTTRTPPPGALPQVAFVDPFILAPERPRQRRPPARRHPPRPAVPVRRRLCVRRVTVLARRARCSSTTTRGGGFWDHVTPPVVDDPRAADGVRPARVPDPGAAREPVRRGPHATTVSTTTRRSCGSSRRTTGYRVCASIDAGARDDHDRNIVTAFGGFADFEPAFDTATIDFTAPPSASVPCAVAEAAARERDRQPRVVGLARGVGLRHLRPDRGQLRLMIRVGPRRSTSGPEPVAQS